MGLGDEIALRPRFKLRLDRDNMSALKTFDAAKFSQRSYLISREDDHIFIQLPKEEQHYWSPQLHLKVDDVNADSCLVKGVFGPNPTVWSLFMILHFLVAGVFIAFAIWAYTNWNHKKDYTLQLYVMFGMVVLWFILYFAGRMGKHRGKKEMQQLNDFMVKILEL